MMGKWRAYSDARDHAVQDDTPYGYTQRNTREVMERLLSWTSEGIRSWMTIICDCIEQYRFVWLLFGLLKWQQFVVDCLCGCGVIECAVYFMDCICACRVVLLREGSGCPNYMWWSSQTIDPRGPLYLATDLTKGIQYAYTSCTLYTIDSSLHNRIRSAL